MKQVLLFDIDGTLTGYRKAITPANRMLFEKLCHAYPVYLITGSDRKKLRSQIPDETVAKTKGYFTCSGSEHWSGDTLVSQKKHTFPEDLTAFVEDWISKSRFPLRTGRHVEVRTASLNVSVVGRNATDAERNIYGRFEEKTSERSTFVQDVADAFPDYDVFRGGQISIDITPKGWNKAQCLPTVLKAHPDHEIHFFGDNMSLGGNDRPLSDAILHLDVPGFAYPVSSPTETFEILGDFLNRGKQTGSHAALPTYARSNLSIALV